MYSSENVVVFRPRNKLSNRAIQILPVALSGFLINGELNIREKHIEIAWINHIKKRI